MLAFRIRSAVPLFCALAVVACQDHRPTGPVDDPLTPLAAKGLFNGPGLRGTIVFVSDRSGNFDLYETELGSGFVRQLTTSPANDQDPYWWDRGRSLLFTSSREGNFEVHALDVASGAITRLTSDPGADGSASGHRDLVAFASTRDGDFDIYVLDAATGFVKQLTNDPAADLETDISPDGKYVVFKSNRSGTNDIWMVEVATGVTTPLTSGLSNDAAPAFSPRGREVAFVRNGEIWMLDLRTGEESRLTDAAAGHPWPAAWPAWSPNGDFIALTSSQDGDWEIYALHIESGAVAQITDDPATDTQPTWKK